MANHSDPQGHELFRRFPLTGQVELSCGTVPVPYHVYDGYGLFIGGTAAPGAVQELLAGERVVPLRTRSGRALVGIWICDFTTASLGAHQELQFSVFVAEDEIAPIGDDPLDLLTSMLMNPRLRMLCHGLWNNEPRVVAYNRELLLLDALCAVSRIERSERALDFEFADQASGTPLLSGSVLEPRRRSLRCDFALLGKLGFSGIRRVAREPTVRLQIVNTAACGLQQNAVADSYTRTAYTALHRFDPARDDLLCSSPRYRSLQFAPSFVQYMEGFRFVYLVPRALGAGR